jgi:hypothetical protein
MASGLRCKATSFSGLTTGILNTMLHIILGGSLVFTQQSIKGGKLALKLAMASVLSSGNDSHSLAGKLVARHPTKAARFTLGQIWDWITCGMASFL